MSQDAFTDPLPDTLPYERLDVYQAAVHLLTGSRQVMRRIPVGNSDLVDQLRRATLSCVLNIAEGCGKTTQREQRRFFAIARGSAMECGAIFDSLYALELCTQQDRAVQKRLVIRIVQMLSKMHGLAKV
jgi:four helix bundle protein